MQVVEKAKKEINAFYTKDGPEKILFFYQVRARQAFLWRSMRASCACMWHTYMKRRVGTSHLAYMHA